MSSRHLRFLTASPNGLPGRLAPLLRLFLWSMPLLLAPQQSIAAEQPETATATAAPLEWIRVSEDSKGFVKADSGKPFVCWGFNYDRDFSGRLLEDYWQTEWDVVAADFQEMQDLKANVIRIHLQLGRFMKTAEEPDQQNLERLQKLVQLAEKTGLYLDITGLGCYHKKDIPDWYDTLAEADRWEVQARFWRAVAAVCRDSPAVFCYNLMNEPVLPGAKPETEWLAGELSGKHYVQRISLDLAGRTRIETARQWAQKLTSAIREVDSRHLITVGVIPWAQIFKGAKPIFYAPEVKDYFDFASVHFYPRTGQLEETLTALKVYDVGLPLVIEEIFPLNSSQQETAEFIQRSQALCSGWISFYWGKTIEENEQAGDLLGAICAAWLRYFRDHAPADTE